MENSLLLLSFLLLCGEAYALKCYECHDLRASSDDPGLSAIFDEKAAGNTYRCPPDKTPGGVTCSANINQCVADNVTMVIETRSADGLTNETGVVHSFATRDCFPVANKEYPEDCYPATDFADIYEDSIRSALGDGFTGDVIIRNLEGYTCLCKTGWCNDQLDADGTRPEDDEGGAAVATVSLLSVIAAIFAGTM